MRASPQAAGQIAMGGAALSFVLCMGCTGGGVSWFDAPELAAAAQQLGIAHSPGEPGYRLVHIRPALDVFDSFSFHCMLPQGDLNVAWKEVDFETRSVTVSLPNGVRGLLYVNDTQIPFVETKTVTATMSRS